MILGGAKFSAGGWVEGNGSDKIYHEMPLFLNVFTSIIKHWKIDTNKLLILVDGWVNGMGIFGWYEVKSILRC